MSAMSDAILNLVAGILTLVTTNQYAMYFVVIGLMISLVSVISALISLGKQ